MIVTILVLLSLQTLLLTGLFLQALGLLRVVEDADEPVFGFRLPEPTEPTDE